MINPFSTIEELLSRLKNKDFTPKELTEFFYKRFQKYDVDLNTTIKLFDPAELFEKQRLDNNGILSGIPCLVKDLFCMSNSVTTTGSKILQNFKPCFDATAVERINQQGGIILGKANMDEFAMGATGTLSAFGVTKNPWDTSRIPGGSSSGIAAAVAAGLIPWGVGSETGGSVRQPAAFCGLVGLYPTYGLLSRFGLIAFGSSLDQPGPLTRTVGDAALAMSVLAGHDPKDSSSLPEPVFNYRKNLDGKLPKDLKIGIIADSFSDNIDSEIRASVENTVKILEALGASFKKVSLESFKFGVSVYFILSRAEAASNLARIDGALYGKRPELDLALEDLYAATRSSGFGNEVKKRIMLGNYVLSSAHRDVYEKASFARNMIRYELEAIFSEVDLLICPTTTSLPPKLEGQSDDPLAIYLSDYFSLPNCVAGCPAITFPAGKSASGLPLGVQLIGPRLSEELLLQVAYAYEQNSEFINMNPNGFN